MPKQGPMVVIDVIAGGTRTRFIVKGSYIKVSYKIGF